MCKRADMLLAEVLTGLKPAGKGKKVVTRAVMKGSARSMGVGREGGLPVLFDKGVFSS